MKAWERKNLMYWLRLSRPASMYMVSSGLVDQSLRFLAFALHLWQASSEVVASTDASEVLEVGCCFRTHSVCDFTAAISSWEILYPVRSAGRRGYCNV